MKEKIIEQFNNLGHGQIGLENGDFIDFETAKNFISQALDEYADWKIKECLGEIVSREFPRGERKWCIECASRIKKEILSNKDKK